MTACDLLRACAAAMALMLLPLRVAAQAPASTPLPATIESAAAALARGDLDAVDSMLTVLLKAPTVDWRTHEIRGGWLIARADDMLQRRTGGAFVAAVCEDAAGAFRAARAVGGAELSSADADRLQLAEADAERRAGRFDAALRALHAFAARAPANGGALLIEARVHVSRGRPGDAVAPLSALLALTPAPAEAADGAGLLIEALLAAGDRAGLARQFVPLVQRFPGAPAARIFEAVWTRFRDAAGDATWPALLAAAKTAGERDLTAFYDPDLAYRRGRFAEAAVGFRAYRGLHGNDPLAAYCTALAELAAGDLARAPASVDQATELGYDAGAVVDLRRQYVGRLFAAKRWTEAAEAQRVVVAADDRPEDVLDLGVLLLDAGKPAEALTVYAGLAAREDVPAALRSRAINFGGLLERGQGHAGVAEAAFRRAAAVSDLERDAVENLGVHLIDAGRYAEAAGVLQRTWHDDRTRKRSLYHLLRATTPALR